MKTEIFVGRKTELKQFRQALGKRGLLRRFLLLLLPGRGVRSRVFLPYGIGGIGKTWLSQGCLREADQTGWATVEVDWDRADYRPSETGQLMDIVAARVKSALGEKTIKPYWDTRTQARQVHDRVTRYRQENQEKWQSIVNSVKGMTEAVAGLARGKEVGAAAGGAVEKVGGFVGGGAALLAQAEDAFMDWLIERKKLKPEDKSLYRKPETHLADRLVDAFVAAARHRPLVVLFDSCEILSLRLEEWLRDAIVCPAVQRDAPLLFVVVGRFNQYVGREVEDDSGDRRYVKGYADRLSDPPPISWDLSRFADPEIVEYLEARDLEPSEELVGLVQELARGVPFAVQLVTDALCDLGEEQVRVDFATEGLDLLSPQEMVTRVVQRFLSYCVDETDRDRVRALAILRRTDKGVLRKIWQLEEKASPQAVLADLEARYSFVQTGGQLHDVVRDFLRDDLRSADRERAHRLGKLAAEYYRPLWEQTTTAIERLDERAADPRWRKRTHNLLNALCWGDEDRVFPFAAARVIEVMEFDLGFAHVLLKLTREFHEPDDWWPGRHHRILSLLTQIVEGETKEEWVGLEGLLGQVKQLGLGDAHRCILHLWRARNLSQREKPEEALAALEQARRRLPDEGEALKQQLGEAFYELSGKFIWPKGTATSVQSAEGLQAAQAAVELFDESGRAHYNLGVALDDFQRYEEAIAAYQRAIELDPTDAYPHNGLGNVYDDLGRQEEAIAAFRRAIALDPDYAYPHHGLGNVYDDLGRQEEAIAAYQRAIELDSTDAYPHYDLGSVYSDLGRQEDAIAAYRRAIELDSTDAYPHNGLGNVYRALGRQAEAIAAYQRAIELDPTFADPHNGLGFVYTIYGQYEEAIASFERAVELDPHGAWPHNNLGVLYRHLDRYDESIAVLQRAVDLDPSSGLHYANFAATCREIGQEENYKKCIRHARKLMEDESEYGKACIESIAGNVDAAMEHLAKALEKAPGDRKLARRDPDFAFIRDDPRFRELVGSTSDRGNTG